MREQLTTEDVLNRIRASFAAESQLRDQKLANCLEAVDALDTALWRIGAIIERCPEGPTKGLLGRQRELLRRALQDAKACAVAL